MSVEDGIVYLCQNSLNGNAAKDKKGFKWSWSVENGTYDCLLEGDVTNFELLPEPRVIFTNCVGEVFTDEDIKDDILVWHYGHLSNRVFNNYISEIGNSRYAAASNNTDIFRSKKSLLKYLYETCD